MLKNFNFLSFFAQKHLSICQNSHFKVVILKILTQCNTIPQTLNAVRLKAFSLPLYLKGNCE